MPIYEYQCTKCGHELESLQKISDEPLTTCPACSQNELKKLVSASSFRLKGGGWYETDFKKDNKKHIADSGNSDKESTESKEDAKSSTKKSSDTVKPASETQAKTNTTTSK